MSCKHLKLKKFHIKSTFLISLKFLKSWSSRAPILRDDVVRPRGKLALLTACGSLPGCQPTSFAYCCVGIGVWEPHPEKESRRGEIHFPCRCPWWHSPCRYEISCSNKQDYHKHARVLNSETGKMSSVRIQHFTFISNKE